MRFQVIYPYKWAQQFNGDNDLRMLAKNEWKKGLHGLSGKQITDALDYCAQNLDWPPSIAEFRKIASGQMQILSVNDAWADVAMQVSRGEYSSWSTPLIEQAISVIGGKWTFNHEPATVVQKMFKSAYKSLKDAENGCRSDARIGVNQTKSALEALKHESNLPTWVR